MPRRGGRGRVMSDAGRNTMRAVIVDDEALARSIVREYLEGQPDVEVVAECADGFEAVRAVNDLKPDLIFLDIQMPKLDGFEVLELIGNEVEVLFVTAYDEYALRAFEVNALDYLLKPFSAERFAQALERARERLRRPGQSPAADTAIRRDPAAKLERILIRNGPKVHVIGVDQIDYVKAEDDYVGIVVAGKSHLKHQTLNALEAELDPRRFVRIHRSTLLNIDRLERIELYAKDSYEAILRDGTRLPISRSGYTRLQELV
jgi:two-component system LytT family response regulator